ncbi:MAG TPA: FimV/HubP family polar landmark protein [Burkholderiales bacterium]|nr:FimV/HubP family polar landmark protein [Burkholderiales bacterium]
MSLILPSLAWAAGLGKLSALSQLGQPLRAEIEIVSLQKGEGDTLGARLAPGEVFRQANIDLNPALMSVKFAVERRPGGQYVMTLTSGQPINEPFIDVLVELNWANGRLVREYTFLLDPPEYAGPPKLKPLQAAQLPAAELSEPVALAPPAEPITPASLPEPVPAAPGASAEPIAPAQVASAETGAPAQETGGESASPTPAQVQVLPAEVNPAEPVPVQVDAALAAPPPAKLVQEFGISDIYEVVRGDTLSKIAIRNRVEGVSLQQMLVALFRANKEAFVADNMNRLRAGKIISIPDKDAAGAVAAADARRIVSVQYADFNEYRRRLGIAVASTPASQGGRQASGQISAPKEEKPIPSKEPPKDELRLSRADDAKRGAKAAGTAAADDLAAKDNALKETQERIALLEKNLQDMQKLAQIKSQTGAQLQQQAEAAKAASAAKATEPAKVAPAAKAEAPKAPEPAKAAPKAPETAKAPLVAKAPEATRAPEPAKVPEAAKAPEPAKAPEAAKAPETVKAPEPAKAPESAAKAPEPAKMEVAKAAPKAAAKGAPAPPPIDASFVDELLDNPVALGTAGGAVLLLAGYAAYAWRRKRNSQFENSIMSVVPSDADSVLGSVGGRNVDTSSSSLQSDFSQGGVGKADTEEIDPIAEADVYMAYGRDAQAEEILRDALAKDSSRQAIRVKLLEIYANRKDTRSFEAAANELRAATGGRGAEWEKVAGLGLSIDPANALYGGNPGNAPQRFNETAQMPAFSTSTAHMPAFSTSTQPTPEPAAPLNIDFDIGAATSGGLAPLPDLDLGVGSASSAESAAGLDFDLGLGGDKSVAIGTTAAASAIPAAEPLSIDFDLPMGDRPGYPASADAAPRASAAPAADLGAIDFDLGIPSGGSEAKTEIPNTPSVDLADISLDLGTPGGGNGSGGAPDARWQEVATKLDLAKAYEEMGDKDGARELLKEVVKEGDAAQQQQAQTMLQALG